MKAAATIKLAVKEKKDVIAPIKMTIPKIINSKPPIFLRKFPKFSNIVLLKSAVDVCPVTLINNFLSVISTKLVFG